MLEHQFNDFIEKQIGNPDFMATYSGIAQKINSGFFKPAYLDVIYQLWDAIKLEMIDQFRIAYCFGQIHYMLMSGSATMVHFEVGEEPSSDAEIEENNKKLKHGLNNNHKEFELKANFIGKFGPSDGEFKWSKPIPFEFINMETGERELIKIKKGHAPLEVGYTAPETTLMHLIQQRSLCRWPYGSKFATLIVRKESCNLFNIDF